MLPTCSVNPCSPSVTPSVTPALSVVPTALFKRPMFLTPNAFNTPDTPAAPNAPDQSSQFGSSLLLFLALSNATGPAI